jgi:hypothetical protein
MLYDLSADELDSLRKLAQGAQHEPMLHEHAERLLSLGLAKETPNGLAITALGRAHLAMTVWAGRPHSTAERDRN